MDKSYLLLVTLLLALGACGGTALQSKGGGGGFGSDKDDNDVTSTSSCLGNPPPSHTIYAAWKKSFINKYPFDLKYQIATGNMTRVTKTCHFASGVTLDATVDVPSTVQNNHYAIQSSRAYTTTTKINGVTYNCTVTTKSFNAPYVFRGNCLGLVSDGKTTFFIPSP